MATASHPALAGRCSPGFARGSDTPTSRRSAGSITSTSKVYISYKTSGLDVTCNGAVGLNHQVHNPYGSKKRFYLHYTLLKYDKDILSFRWLEYKRHFASFHKARRTMLISPLASSDDGVTVNGMPQSSYIDQISDKLDQMPQNEDPSSRFVQAMHDAARAVELSFLEHSSLSKSPWFSPAWLGVDKNAWIKPLSYQAAVDSLLQATIEISSRGDGRDRDINVFVYRSLSRLRGPLESAIQVQLSTKQPAAFDWYCSHQQPLLVTTFVNLFEKDQHFSAATMLFSKGGPAVSPIASDFSLLMLALCCLAAITKLGSTKLSCQQFFSMVPDIIGRVMDMLLNFVPISKAYQSMKDIGLHREFLFHFGPRATLSKVANDNGVEEISFWVDLVQRQLQRAIDRERIWSRLTTSESIEVLEKDLAIFGFFIALGRSTQSFLSSNGFTSIDNPINGIIRYLIGGSVLYYPQLSSISSYQLYVEVVCEELEWLPFYQTDLAKADSGEGTPQLEIISTVLDGCSYWVTSFIKYSTWLEVPSNIKAAKFLSRGHIMLNDCMRELGTTKYKDNTFQAQVQLESKGSLPLGQELNSFDQALESVEEALVRLENLLQELHVSSSNPGKEHLKAACSDLEKIRKLKKETEFLEVSFRAKAASLEQVVDDESTLSSASGLGDLKKVGRTSNETAVSPKPLERADDKSRDFWSFLVRSTSRKTEPGRPNTEHKDMVAKVDAQGSQSNDIHRFEKLRHELIELEKRVQRSADDSQYEEEVDLMDGKVKRASATLHHVPAPAHNDGLIARSVEKLKETTTDVWQGTQLLAIDVSAAMVLLRRTLAGDELTEKEKKALQRTLTDLASVVPIGILMLLPVTAVGHAAILAFIQRYIPALIPSTYAPERLDLLRQLEKVKEMQVTEANTTEVPETLGLSSRKFK